MIPVWLRYLLTFLLLTAAAPHGSASAQPDEPSTLDEAPAASVSIGHKTPESDGVEPYTTFAASASRFVRRPEVLPAVVAVRAPRCTRRVIKRIHWVRRRVPRLRDDAPDH